MQRRRGVRPTDAAGAACGREDSAAGRDASEPGMPHSVARPPRQPRGGVPAVWGLLVGICVLCGTYLAYCLGSSLWKHLPGAVALAGKASKTVMSREGLEECQMSQGHVVATQQRCSIKAHLALAREEQLEMLQELRAEVKRQQNIAEERQRLLDQRDAELLRMRKTPDRAEGSQTRRRPQATNGTLSGARHHRHQAGRGYVNGNGGPTSRVSRGKPQVAQGAPPPAAAGGGTARKTTADAPGQSRQGRQEGQRGQQRRQAGRQHGPGAMREALPPKANPRGARPPGRETMESPPWQPNINSTNTLARAQAERMSIVITWVNGSDADYQKLRREYGGPRSVGGSRDRDSGELLHALRSVERFMPWHKGRIFLVTPGQIPSWLNTSHPKITVVDQDSIIPPSAVPTFSSNVIEQWLHKIPGVGPYFVYWNDDNFLGRMTTPGDFITPGPGVDGRPHLVLFMTKGMLRGGADTVHEARKSKGGWHASLSHTNGLLDEAYGVHSGRKHICHAPYVFSKAAMEQMHVKWPQQLNATLYNRFRRWNDTLVPYLHHYLVVNEGPTCCGVLHTWKSMPHSLSDEFQFVILTNNRTANAAALQRIREERPKFYTLNDSFKDPKIPESQMRPFFIAMNRGYRGRFELQGINTGSQ